MENRELSTQPNDQADLHVTTIDKAQKPDETSPHTNTHLNKVNARQAHEQQPIAFVATRHLTAVALASLVVVEELHTPTKHDKPSQSVILAHKLKLANNSALDADLRARDVALTWAVETNPAAQLGPQATVLPHLHSPALRPSSLPSVVSADNCSRNAVVPDSHARLRLINTDHYFYRLISPVFFKNLFFTSKRAYSFTPKSFVFL